MATMSRNGNSAGGGAKAKAQELLAFAREQARQGKTGIELFLVVFGSRGKARMLFPTKAAWGDLERTEEVGAIRALIDSAAKSRVDSAARSEHSVLLHMPKSVHAALTKEAAAEGVSLEQLCLSKLVAQLRELV